VANPDPEVRSSRRVNNAAFYPSAGPDLQIRIRHWTGTNFIGGCMSCIGRFAEVRNHVDQAGIEEQLLCFPDRILVAIYAMLCRLQLKVNAHKLQLS
jgi:hypothetical protein